jgi:hypothetical protein
MSRNAAGPARGRDFLVGLAGGAIALAIAWPVYQWHARQDAGNGTTTTLVEPAAWQAAQLRAAASAPMAQPASLPVAAPAQHCEFAPMLPLSGPDDGRFLLEPPLAARPTARHAAFLQVARDASQAGHYRDAEVALIVACRLAARASPSPTVPLADVQALLGQYYAAAGLAQPAGAERAALLARARDLLARSSETYAQALGRHASKTRLARERLAALPDDDGGETTQQASPRLETVLASGPAAPAAAQPPAPAAQEPAQASAPRLVAADPQLAQLDSDLQRLRAQAASVSRDPAGLQQRVRAAQARRDAACSDKACLLRWYAQRRDALLREF